jgi:ATP-binding cassette subfamily F protein uup
LLLVSHDRDFLDNVVTSTLVMEGNGRVGEYVGGYSDWLRQRPGIAMPAPVATAARPATPPPVVPPSKRKLSYKDARELEQLPARIEALEARLAEMAAAMNEPAFYQRGSEGIAAHNAAMASTQAELDAAYARWAELDA